MLLTAKEWNHNTFDIIKQNDIFTCLARGELIPRHEYQILWYRSTENTGDSKRRICQKFEEKTEKFMIRPALGEKVESKTQ
jgi:hypothetical protein